MIRALNVWMKYDKTLGRPDSLHICMACSTKNFAPCKRLYAIMWMISTHMFTGVHLMQNVARIFVRTFFNLVNKLSA